jgi:hypothetical protein
VVETIAADPEVWLRAMMAQELQLAPVDMRAMVRRTVVVMISCLVGHLIPLIPFLLLARGTAIMTSIVVSGAVLFGVGVYSALSLVGDWRKSGAQMLIIGLGAAARLPDRPGLWCEGLSCTCPCREGRVAAPRGVPTRTMHATLTVRWQKFIPETAAAAQLMRQEVPSAPSCHQRGADSERP